MTARRRGPERAHDHAAVVRVRAEDRVRVRVLAADDAVEVGGGGDGHMGIAFPHSASSSRRIPATGMPTQSGRLLSS